MSPCAKERPATSACAALARASMAGDESMPTVSSACIFSCRILVRSPVPHPRSTMRPPGTGWHSLRRSSKGCWRSERNRSYWSGLHPSIGVTVTALMSSPSRDARRPQAARRAATRRLTWANGSPAGPAAARGYPPPSPRPVRRAHRADPAPAPGSASATAPPSTLSRLPRKVVQAPPSRTTRLSSTAGSAQSRWRSSLVIFSAMVTSPRCGTGSGNPATPSGQRVDDQRAGDCDQLARAAAARVTSSSSGTVRTA